MRVLMLVNTDLDGDARVQREARTLTAAGHQVTVIALFGAMDDVEVIAVGGGGPSAIPRPTSPLLAGGRRAARWLLLPSYVQRQRAAYLRVARQVAVGLLGIEAVHAHDFEVLELGAGLAARWDVPLVYDSHELWPHRVRHGRPTPLVRRREQAREQALGSRAAAVITVGEEIADWMAATYGWGHVTVVRNSFPAVDLPPLEGPPTGLLYAGRIADRRELDVLAAATDLPLPAVVMGPGDAALRARLAASPHVAVREPVTVEAVVDAYRELGIALVTTGDGPLSYRWSLPNKLFQAVQAGVPVIATDLPAQHRLVRQHRLGELYEPGDPRSLTAAVHRLLDGYDDAVSAVGEARSALSWEVDARRLLAVYDGLGAGRDERHRGVDRGPA